jgi:hypothetical protein
MWPQIGRDARIGFLYGKGEAIESGYDEKWWRKGLKLYLLRHTSDFSVTVILTLTILFFSG